MSDEKPTPAEDMIYGAPGISEFTGLTERQVYHYKKELGLGKLGTTLIGSKTKLRSVLVGLTEAA